MTLSSFLAFLAQGRNQWIFALHVTASAERDSCFEYTPILYRGSGIFSEGMAR